MPRRSVLRFAWLLAALAFLLPLAAVADTCSDCLWAVSPDCCPPACCSCCVPGLSVLTASAWGALPLETLDLASSPLADRPLSFHPRDVFHVPKPSLI